MSRALEPQYETWPANASISGHEVHTGRPWVPSPQAELFSLPPECDSVQKVIPTVPRNHRQHAPQRKQGKRRNYADDDPWKGSSGSWLSFLFRKRKSCVAAREEDAENWPSVDGGRRIVKPEEWRAYGYWARPTINGVTVDNAKPSSSRPPNLSRQEVEAVFRSLRGSRRSKHPENWIARVHHPSLPPRPSLWPTPPPSPHLPLPPSDIQLNPFLEHRLFGRPPIIFDLRSHPHLPLLGEREAEPGDIDQNPQRLYMNPRGPNGAQPATYPGVSILPVTALADDTFPEFLWPFHIRSSHDSLPVSVYDVLNALIANFEALMEPVEIAALSQDQCERIWKAYDERVNTMTGGRYPMKDGGVRRIDYLGERRFFRGFEPAPDGRGFMLFLGMA